MYETIVKGATVVTAADTFQADIGIAQGRIAALGRDLRDAAEVIEADGLLALPGGIDSHVHIAQPSGDGVVMADDFASGTRSAACGGNTTILPFCLQQRGQRLREALDDYHALAAGQCHVDVGFHLILADPTPHVLGQELPALVAEGYTSLKLFMTYEGLALSDRQILDTMDVARETGALVMVHAENEDAIRFLWDKAERHGETAPKYHAATRPVPVEREATHRAISLAEIAGVPLMVVHVSNREAMEEIDRARRRGLKVFGETCPQYLMLTAEDLDLEGMEGARFVCSPPPRDRASQAACWEGLETGIFDVFSSDHCPFRWEDTAGKQHPKGRQSFRWIPNGIPGVETRLPILFSEGVRKGRISVNRFVALTATNHARLYGLYPRKGTLAVGSDADITLWDPERRCRISQSRLHHGADYTPYEGLEVEGWPVRTMVRGVTVALEGEIVGPSGHGRYLRRHPGRLGG
ncbi:dihydropyrimidinase [Lutibaculum baratangense]|uniref:D-hydantoinase n=1 Tax=Lutibaculum baratangense AMV1 TaxID=631454 RepID=V4RIR5_9HYPH|nr:dihydropyrimidinase [Lutibaculum baratangense]ESR25224.1 D-hydantoinase [Lutibaculum baratangense AMV1]